MYQKAKKMRDTWPASTQTMAPTAKIIMDGELPAKGSIPYLFNEMDYHQAIQCYLWALPIVAYQTFKEIHEKKFAATSFDIVVYDSYQDKLGLLTANATTSYVQSFIDLARTGPVVIELPGGSIAGGLNDSWQREIISMGEAGSDKGRGGKYLLLPPGHKSFRAIGYYMVSCPTMNMSFGFRILISDREKATALINAVKIYAYEKRLAPQKTRVITPYGKKCYAIQPEGLDYWKTLNTIFQEEPVEERDRFFVAWLDNLGIKKDKPFEPNERQKKDSY